MKLMIGSRLEEVLQMAKYYLRLVLAVWARSCERRGLVNVFILDRIWLEL
jgi:hypothetical protein